MMSARQLPVVEDPSRVPTPEGRLELGGRGAAARRGTAVGTVPSASPPLTAPTAGAGDPAVRRDNDVSKGFASATTQCLLLGLFSWLGWYFF